MTTNYLNGAGNFATTEGKLSSSLCTQIARAWFAVRYTRDNSSLTVTIQTRGTYAELPALRPCAIRVVNSFPAISVRFDT